MEQTTGAGKSHQDPRTFACLKTNTEDSDSETPAEKFLLDGSGGAHIIPP